MHPQLPIALDRTFRLMRDHLIDEVDNARLLSSLTNTDVVLVGDASNLASHAAQSAYITAALLSARSGHRVHLLAPDVPLVGPQPPLRGTRLVSALLEISTDLLPGLAFSPYAPRSEAALCIVFGDSSPRVRARRTLGINATAWSAQLGPASSVGRWAEERWPCGALGAGALAAVEGFKTATQSLRPFAIDPMLFDLMFAFTDRMSLDLAPADTPQVVTLEEMDFVSGGAITNAVLYVLVRLLGVHGRGRIIEPETPDLSNLNRYMLLLRSALDCPKAALLRQLAHPHMDLQAISARYDGPTAQLGDFAPNVLVGVDDIPTRWTVQEQQPGWLGIGATSHWEAMASYHESGVACARCLHPRDEPNNDPVPTIAFVSFFAGLELACYFLRAQSGAGIPAREQYIYLAPVRAEHTWRTAVAPRQGCLTCVLPSEVRVA